MATLSQIKVADKYSALDSGAAFLLAQKCDVNEIVYLDSGSEVEVQKDCSYVVARIKGSLDPNDAFNKGYEVAQQGLDILAITGKASLSIRNAPEEYLVWWREENAQILRVVTITKLSVGIDTLTLQVTDKDSNIIPQPSPPKLKYHESLRYFRLSQVTDDLFDAFRNMYLAFELLLEYFVPKLKGDTEGKWLKKALNTVNNNFPLASVYNATASDIVEDIYNDIYKNLRCAIFHAKNNSRLLPQDLLDRRRVSEGLERLTRIVLLLTENLLNARHPTGGMSYSCFNMMTLPLMEKSTVIVSDDDTPLEKLENLNDSSFKDSVFMLTRHAPELSEPGLNSVLGVVDANELNSLNKIAKFGLVHNKELMIGAAIEAPLTHESIDRLEAQISLQLKNVKAPKRFFKS